MIMEPSEESEYFDDWDLFDDPITPVINSSDMLNSANVIFKTAKNVLFTLWNHVTDMTWKDGLYTGPVNDLNVPHGIGVFKYGSLYVYEGNVRNGMFHGIGKILFENGTEMEVSHVSGVKEGVARLTIKSNKKIKGFCFDQLTSEVYFEKGKLQSMSCIENSEINREINSSWIESRSGCVYTYSGYINSNGFPDQKGLLTGSQHFKYDGLFQSGSFHGAGILYDLTGGIFSGEFLYGIPIGNFTYMSSELNKFEFQYFENLIRGKKLFKNGDTYEGEFNFQLQMDGAGYFVSSKGDSYTGNFSFNKKHGKGIQKWIDGDMYEGTYVDGEMDGYGKFVTTSGTYVGNWKNGKKHGRGNFTWSDGETYSGIWDENELVEEIKF